MKTHLLMKGYIVSALMLFALATRAQQLPVYNQYKYNQFVLNPALSSMGDDTPSLSLLHRNQWSGVDGAPETSLLSYNGEESERNIGYAAYLFHDKTGILSTTSFYGNYSYKFVAFDGFVISLGLSAGVVSKGINKSEINIPDLSDPLYNANISDRTTFDFNFGVSASYKNFELGFAAPQLFANSINYASELTDTSVAFGLERHYIGMLKYHYDFRIDAMGYFGNYASIVPQVVARYLPNTPVQLDLHTMLDLRNLGWVGVGYRTKMGWIANLGLNLTSDLSVAYAYEVNTTKVSRDLGSSHELMLVYKFGADRRQDERVRLEMDEMRREELELMTLMERQMRDRQDSIALSLREDIILNANRLEETEDKIQASAVQSIQMEDDLSTTASNVVAGSKGFYVVAGVFAFRKNAENITNQLSSEGYDVDYFYNKANRFYYVFLRKYKSYEAALEIKKSNINGTYFNELWIKKVE